MHAHPRPATAGILNIAAYLFVVIDDADALAVRIRDQLEAAGLYGSALVTPEGLNLFLAGPEAPLRGFLDWLRADARFAALYAKESWSEEVPFARLKVKRKDEIIAFRREHASPLEAGERAPAVDPPTLQRWIVQGHDDAGKPVRMLDTRNREEIGYGTFRDAITLPMSRYDIADYLGLSVEAVSRSLTKLKCRGAISLSSTRCVRILAPEALDLG